MICSMSHKGDCYDNAVMESFFGSLKTEWTQGCSYQTRAQAKRDVVEYIERFYNVRRRHSYLGNISPAEFERRMEQADLRKLSDSDALPGSRNDDLDDARLSTLGSSGCYTN
jgi:transposase InsO family protein